MRLAFRNAFAFPHAILLSQSNAIRCNGIINKNRNKKTYEYHNCCIIDWLCDSCAMCANVRWWRRLRPNSQKSPSIFYFISFYCALPAASFQCLSIDTDFCWSTTNDNIWDETLYIRRKVLLLLQYTLSQPKFSSLSFCSNLQCTTERKKERNEKKEDNEKTSIVGILFALTGNAHVVCILAIRGDITIQFNLATCRFFYVVVSMRMNATRQTAVV